MQDFLIVSQSDAFCRLDQLLAKHFGLSRSYFQYLISEQAVLVNDKPVKKSCKVEAGDEIQVEFLLTKEIELEPEAIPLDILYEDSYLVAINKPAGLVVHPAPGNWSGTFVNALLYHCKGLERDESLRPGIVHRLDKETSGVLLAAKTRATHQALTELFAKREVEKTYLAICHGTPSCTVIDAPIGRHPVRRKEMAVIESGKPAKTHIKVRASSSLFSLVEIGLETGRTHQIRVHLKYIGHPILGDALYGRGTDKERFRVHRQMLHAERIAFQHPITKEPLTLQAPLPEDMHQALVRFIQGANCKTPFGAKSALLPPV